MIRSAPRPTAGPSPARTRRARRAALALLPGALLPGALLLLAAPAGAQAVVQPIPNPAAARLTAAMQTLSRSPHSLEALVTAGEASLAIGDVDGAVGFFTRAGALAPADGRVTAGLAVIALRQDRPTEALALFTRAEQQGAPPSLHAADRGLAHDLVGDNAGAQRFYALALAGGPDDEVTRRLAISQAIAGDRLASEATLLPLLQRQDMAAYRARAFALAILGREDEAVSIAETMLPPRLSGRLAPYLRYMRRLTRAQQAAAANLGRFPRSEEIGRDAPAIAALSGAAPQAPAPRSADAGLVPSGAPLGPAARPVRRSPLPRPVPTTIPAAPQPAAPAATAAVELPPVAQPDPTAAPGPQLVLPEPATPAPAPAPVRAPAPAPAPTPAPDLASAFAGFTLPASAPVAAPRSGAVDITAFEPRREAPPPRAAPPPPPPPPAPSRHWLQVATGRDVAALAWDWRRIKRQADGLLDDATPHLAAWGESTRLLAGPFSAREVQQLITKLKAKAIDTFRFTSAAGQEVRPLP